MNYCGTSYFSYRKKWRSAKSNLPLRRRGLVSRPRDSRHNCRAGHPRWRRCDSFKYAEYSHSSRLATGAPRSGIYATYHAAGTLGNPP